MAIKPGRGDVALWGLVTAGMWVFGGIICTIIFYQNTNRIPTMQPTPQHMELLAKVLTPWAIVGFIVGLFGLFRFLSLVEDLGITRAYSAHVVQMSIISLILGFLIGCFLYPMFSPPPGAVLRTIFWRIPISTLTALTVTNIALRMIGVFGKLLR